MTQLPAAGSIGVGTGPGDPELLTLKAVRALGEADVVAHFAKRGNNGNARAIVEAHLQPGMIELPLLYPVTTEIDRRSRRLPARDRATSTRHRPKPSPSISTPAARSPC